MAAPAHRDDLDAYLSIFGHAANHALREKHQMVDLEAEIECVSTKKQISWFGWITQPSRHRLMIFPVACPLWMRNLMGPWQI